MEVPVPAAALAVILDPLAQPVPLHRADRGFGVQDQARDLLAAAFVIGGLVAGQPGAARAVAVLDVDGTAAGGPVGDPLAALRARPGQRRVAALAAGQLFNRVLSGGEQQVRAGSLVIRSTTPARSW